MAEKTTRQYVDRCVTDAQLCRAARCLELPPEYARSYGRQLLDRPLFAAADELSGFAADLAQTFAALVAAPGLLFDGDLGRYCSALGMDDRLAGFMLRGATGAPPLHGRADAYHDGSGFRMLEFNLGSELGGADFAQLNRGYLGVPAFAEFAGEHGLGFADTVERLAGALRRAAEPVTGGRDPVVALLEGTGGFGSYGHIYTSLREAMAQRGIEMHIGEIHQSGERNGKITLDGVPADVVLRFFVSDDLARSPSGEQDLDRILRADLAGKTVLFTPLEAGMLASKGSLALLHEPRLAAQLTAGQRAAIDRVVPWTRLLRGGPWQRPDERADLLAYCRARRESLVLKPGVGYGAVGAHVGWRTPQAEWDAVLADCAGGDYVAQWRVVPAAEPVTDPDTGETADWHANWGIFVDAGGYAGAFVRALKPGDGSVISYSNPGTRGTCVFSCPGTE
jgi:hypothetical protein